ncbi:matrixin family metalloprotease [Vibrio parahaemolyticus]
MGEGSDTEASLAFYQDSDGIKNYVRQLMNEALNLWGASVPVRFSENPNVWDFQVSIAPSNNCDPTGACTLARAFFPDPGRNSLLLFPRMFDQVYKEQLDTIVHEMGHIFGLRHFFAPKLETRWPSEIFGNHEAFSIMNYGDMSELTERDLSDLANLYEAAWSGELETINGTPIRFIRPYHEQA